MVHLDVLRLRMPNAILAFSRFCGYFYKWLRRDGLSLGLFFLATAIAVAPMFRGISTTIIGGYGDNVQYMYTAGFIAESITHGRSPLVDTRINPPVGLGLAATDVPFLSFFLAIPVTLSFGPVVSYNLLLILGHLLSGYFTYLWLYRRTGSRVAATIAGLAFMWSPYRIAHSLGHLNLTTTQVLPLFFLALDAFLERMTWRRAWLLGGVTFLIGCSSQYYLVMVAIIGAAYGLFALGPDARRMIVALRMAVVPLLVAAVLSALPYLQQQQANGYHHYPLDTARYYSASVVDFFVPSAYHAIWGDWVAANQPRTNYENVEFILYPGIVTMLFVLVAVWRRQATQQRMITVWLGTALVAGVLALGTDLRTMYGEPVQQQPFLWLPASYLNALPGFNAVRVYARFGVFVALFLAALAGLGAARLWSAKQRWSQPLAILLVMFLCIDLVPGNFPTASMAPRPVDQWLAAQPGSFTVAFYPAYQDNYRALFGTLVHRKGILGYIHPAHHPEQYTRYVSESSHFPNADSIRALREQGLQYLLIDSTQLEEHEKNEIYDQRFARNRIDEVGDFLVFDLRQ